MYRRVKNKIKILEKSQRNNPSIHFAMLRYAKHSGRTEEGNLSTLKEKIEMWIMNSQGERIEETILPSRCTVFKNSTEPRDPINSNSQR